MFYMLVYKKTPPGTFKSVLLHVASTWQQWNINCGMSTRRNHRAAATTQQPSSAVPGNLAESLDIIVSKVPFFRGRKKSSRVWEMISSGARRQCFQCFHCLFLSRSWDELQRKPRAALCSTNTGLAPSFSISDKGKNLDSSTPRLSLAFHFYSRFLTESPWLRHLMCRCYVINCNKWFIYLLYLPCSHIFSQTQ